MLTLPVIVLFCLPSFVVCSFKTLGAGIYLDVNLVTKLTNVYDRVHHPQLAKLATEGQLVMKTYSPKNQKRHSVLADDESIADIVLTNDPDSHGYSLQEVQPSRFQDLFVPSGMSPEVPEASLDVVVQFMDEPPTMEEREKLFDLFASVSFPQRVFLQYIEATTKLLHPIHQAAMIWRDDGDISMSRWTTFRTEDLVSTISMAVNQLGELVTMSLLGADVKAHEAKRTKATIAELCWIIADEISHELNVIAKILRLVLQRLKLASHSNLQYCHLTTESIRIHGFQWTTPFNASVVQELKNSEDALITADAGKYMINFYAHQADFRAATLAYLKTKDTDRFLATTSFPFLYRSKPLGLNDISISGISYGLQSSDPLACLTKYGLIPDIVAFHDVAYSTVNARVQALVGLLGASSNADAKLQTLIMSEGIAPAFGPLLLQFSKYVDHKSFTVFRQFVERALQIFTTDSGPKTTRLWEYTKYIQNYFAQKAEIHRKPQSRLPNPPLWVTGFSDYWPRVIPFTNSFPASEITTIMEGLAKSIGPVGTMPELYQELEAELSTYETEVSNFQADAAKIRAELDKYLTSPKDE